MMRIWSFIILIVVPFQMVVADQNGCIFESLESVSPFECSERNSSLLAIQVGQMRIQLRDAYRRKTRVEQTHLERDLEVYRENLNQLRRCQLQVGRRPYSCSISFPIKESFSTNFFKITDGLSLRETIDEVGQSTCSIETPTARGTQKTIESADGHRMIQGLNQYWNVNEGAVCPLENAIFSSRTSSTYTRIRESVQSRVENFDRRFIFSMKTDEYPTARDSFGMIDWSETSNDDAYKVSYHVKRRIEFSRPRSGGQSTMSEVNGNLRLAWAGGAYIDIDTNGAVIESNFIEESVYSSGQCHTQVRRHGSRYKFLPQIELTDEFSNARVTEQGG